MIELVFSLNSFLEHEITIQINKFGRYGLNLEICKSSKSSLCKSVNNQGNGIFLAFFWICYQERTDLHPYLILLFNILNYFS